jgi:hypothetical protein
MSASHNVSVGLKWIGLLALFCSTAAIDFEIAI